MSRHSLSAETAPILSYENRGGGYDSERSDQVRIVNAVEPESTWTKKRVVEVAAVAYCFFYTGVLLTAIGALFEYFMIYYKINEGLASFVFPIGISGYVSAAFSLSAVVNRTGWRGVAIISPLFHLLGVIVLGLGFPLPIALGGFLICGIGSGLSDAGFNAWASRLRSANVVQGFMHSAFALGCVSGPVFTLTVTSRHLSWFTFYRGMIPFAVLEVILSSLAFRQEGPNCFDDARSHRSVSRRSKVKIIKLLVYCSLYYFVYIGIENCFSNWIVLFMKRIRKVNQTKAALSSSIFWFGMAAGRAGLGPVTGYFGAQTAVIGYILGTICTQGLFLLTDNIPTSFFLLTFNGILMAPMFPSAIVILGQELSLQETIAAVSIATSIGQIGGALAPLAIGLMIDRIGLRLSFDITLCLLVLILILWILFSRIN